MPLSAWFSFGPKGESLLLLRWDQALRHVPGHHPGREAPALDGDTIRILDRAEHASGEAVVTGVRHIYVAAVGAAILCAAFAIAMKELPLRKTVAGGPGEQPAGAAAGGGPEPAPGGIIH